jgi:hypothetical protein
MVTGLPGVNAGRAHLLYGHAEPAIDGAVPLGQDHRLLYAGVEAA